MVLDADGLAAAGRCGDLLLLPPPLLVPTGGAEGDMDSTNRLCLSARRALGITTEEGGARGGSVCSCGRLRLVAGDGLLSLPPMPLPLATLGAEPVAEEDATACFLTVSASSRSMALRLRVAEGGEAGRPDVRGALVPELELLVPAVFCLDSR